MSFAARQVMMIILQKCVIGQLHAVFYVIPSGLIYKFFSYATPVTYGFRFFITYLMRFNSLRATLMITLCPLLPAR